MERAHQEAQFEGGVMPLSHDARLAGSAARRLKRPRWLAALLAWIAMFGGLAPTVAQDFPNRTITMIVPFPPGGGNDTMARIVASKLSAALGQQVVVDNRPGANGVIAMRTAARAAPDGTT